MSEPVAEVVSDDTAGMYEVLPVGTLLYTGNNALLYPADAIERKDAAIAELVGALKAQHSSWSELKMRTPNDIDAELAQLQIETLIGFIAKYDIPKDGL